MVQKGMHACTHTVSWTGILPASWAGQACALFPELIRILLHALLAQTSALRSHRPRLPGNRDQYEFCDPFQKLSA